MVKSISKSYGVPGLRLGVLASGDQDLIAALKKDVAIWNINSFAEFYMQIEEKYKKDYARALELIRAERARFRRELEGLRPACLIAMGYPEQWKNGPGRKETEELLSFR